LPLGAAAQWHEILMTRLALSCAIGKSIIAMLCVRFEKEKGKLCGVVGGHARSPPHARGVRAVGVCFCARVCVCKTQTSVYAPAALTQNTTPIYIQTFINSINRTFFKAIQTRGFFNTGTPFVCKKRCCPLTQIHIKAQTPS
jgi:hypothetical protein